VNSTTPNDQSIDDYVCFDIRAVANHQYVFTLDFASEAAINSDASLEMKFSLEVGPASKQGRQLGGRYRGVHGNRS
jgi:hypothetical protein